ncbi:MULTISPECIES: sodium:proton antiporter [unclassified Shewanella]|uniref:cation:proton antiporter n=1 Tax=unclassified Shewanella TaxID=196818 RepID=UPI001BC79CCF|nr:MULTISPECIES: sodium:proton antiporter [unclassified Shewanella]GIU17959.1 sodium:proton antiporter [Shewanella sp. MBTL60-112-B1]GIU28626.1 sodium:proton antiporter [Shewanella sp. MBTL60-112-B2]
MTSYEILCLLSALSLVISLISSRLHRWQQTITITALALGLSLIILIAGKIFGVELYSTLVTDLEQLDFKALLLNGMLGFLLFAGALQIKLNVLKQQRWEIFVLAFVGTLISTLVIGGLLYLLSGFLGLQLNFSYCLLFGALISPTDPIAVLAIIKQLGAPEDIAIQVEGESLFNDGIGLVIFVAISQVAFSTEPLTFAGVSGLFIREALGGLLYGGVLAAMLHGMLHLSEERTQYLLMTLLVPSAGYVGADMLGVSGPLAMVASGIIIGNVSVPKLLKESEWDHLDSFWLLIESFFNSLLFLLLGLLLLLIHFDAELWWFMLLAVPIVLIGRIISIYLPYFGFRRFRRYNSYAEKILVWGGLRGGLALAMAMSLPTGVLIIPGSNIDLRELLMVMTYAVVVFSILVQGTTIPSLIDKSNAEHAAQRKP